MKQTISVLVENKAGVLNKITSLFSKRAFNIESLAVGVTDDPTLSRITIIVDSGNNVVEQVVKQLNKLIDVVKVRALNETNMVGREMMLVKMQMTAEQRPQIMSIIDIFGAKIVDITPETIMLELTDSPDMINSFAELIHPFGVIETARTGVIALQKGAGKI